MGEEWSVYCEEFRKIYLRYQGTPLYIVFQKLVNWIPLWIFITMTVFLPRPVRDVSAHFGIWYLSYEIVRIYEADNPR